MRRAQTTVGGATPKLYKDQPTVGGSTPKLYRDQPTVSGAIPKLYKERSRMWALELADQQFSSMVPVSSSGLQFQPWLYQMKDYKV